MNRVKHILNRKNGPLFTAHPGMSVREALQIMADKNIGSLVVMEENRYQGVLTERDYARKIILQGKNSADTTVSEIMSTDLPAITREDTLDHCMHLMSDRNIRYLPVIEDNQVLGIVSIKDVIEETILLQRETIHHLQNYISGSVA